MAEPESTPLENTSLHHGWTTSFLFWICLFTSTLCYASVALSPPILRHLNLQREHDRNQLKLVELEQQVEYLEQVGTALEEDPEFAAELVRIDFDAARPGYESIPVDRSLSIDGNVRSARVPTYTDSPPWYSPLVEILAGHQHVRLILLVVAGTLTVTAFTFLHERSPDHPPKTATKHARPGLLGAVAARYRRPPTDD